jgi:hypothetical protein
VSCDDVQALMLDALIQQRAPNDTALLAHMDSCIACRTARAEYETLWREMGRLVAPVPSPDARARFAIRLATVRNASISPPARPTVPWYLGAVAAAVLVAALAGYAVGARRFAERVRPSQTAAVDNEPTFLLLLHEDSAFQRGEIPKPDLDLMAEYARWADGLERSGTLISGTALARDSTIWLGLPHAPSALGDKVDGFFLIRAKDLTAAEQVAATCPHVKHGGRIELRSIRRT